MTSIDKIIQREVNPFGLINPKPGNFWEEKQDSSNSVDSIHQEVITEVEGFLDLVIKDNRSRTLLLFGDSGSGKSYLLGRLKRTLNSKAFFAYIGPWANSDYIWRHVLRSTVDSLIQTPEGQQESQLMLWLKNLSAFTKSNNSWLFLQSDRRKFIQHLKRTYNIAGLYNPDFFFGVLYDLTIPELYPIACEWLRGDDLSEESMQALKVSRCIDSEDAAKNILANLSRISTQTQPIVLCFDNLDNIPRNPDGSQDFQSLFNVNTTIHNSYLKNFLVIISIITNTWKRNSDQINNSADKARIDKALKLKNINLEQVEALWAYQLKPLHQQADSQPKSAIFPLTRQFLTESFLGGKTLPRNALTIAKNEYYRYKLSLIDSTAIPRQEESAKNVKIGIKIPGQDKPPLVITTTQAAKDKPTIAAEFELIWQKEYNKIQEKISKITLLSAPDLIGNLKEALEALQVQGIKQKLISGKYAGYSLSYLQPGKRERVGIVWTEDSNMTSFFNIMNASLKAIQNQLCDKLYLIRISNVGNGKLKGYQLYQQIFTGTQNIHIKPKLSSVHVLATYHSLVNAALAHELVIGGKTINLPELQSLVRESQFLDKCTLLQSLEIIAKVNPTEEKEEGRNQTIRDWRPVNNFLFNLVKTEKCMAVYTLISNCTTEFSDVSESDVKLLIQSLCEEKKVKIINTEKKLQDQLILLNV
ncbi:ATP-binding protein [Plectonema cf. radiosum LEGE 06105]|uniref:ATP-binding protein n=1 Tax=Plectonema cf. radiosum LEGE 06105 TaxID=945769 RepID=A0A8J7JRL9_9CYAN|nr:ATP-binding protein [Plectonema radiosum]MBE9211484.1 ATP-binding protein [Plectonema cf. radiosum LEGE 06105]